MKLSLVMPARNEEGCIIQTLERFTDVSSNVRDFEIVVVDDGSTDATADRLHAFSARHPEVVPVTNTGRHGFGMAIRYGLTRITGRCRGDRDGGRLGQPRRPGQVLPQAAGRLRLRLRLALHSRRRGDGLSACTNWS